MPTRITGIMLAASLLACSSGTIEHATDHDEGELTALAFDPKRVATVTGEVLDIEAYQHIERSRAGVRISVKSGSDTYYVYLAPAKYLDDHDLTLKTGQTVTITGSMLDGDGRPVIIAETIEHAGTRVAMRDDQGLPQWRTWRSWSRKSG